jgi:hypothetical protein
MEHSMDRRLSMVVGVSSLLFSHMVHADPGWTDFATVAELVPTARHYYEVRLQVKENPSGCSEKTWFYQDYGSPGSDNMFKTLLEGTKSGIQLRVYVTGKCNFNGYSEISSVSIVP